MLPIGSKIHFLSHFLSLKRVICNLNLILCILLLLLPVNHSSTEASSSSNDGGQKYLKLNVESTEDQQQQKQHHHHRLIKRHHQELDDTPTCGYDSCPSVDASKLNVHIIPHTHLDSGKWNTFDQYYYGTGHNSHLNPIKVGVQHIFDSIIPQLVLDRNKRFVIAEVAFFVRWWREQTEQMYDVVRQLVSEGRLEFVNGGWCTNDEATVNYHSIIEQVSLGLKFLNETFGHCAHPKVGWLIDSYGHSNEQASLFGQFGFDGTFFARINENEKMSRRLNKSLDFIWHADRALSGQSGSIFASIFTQHYDSPEGFCFDALCTDDNLVDNKQSYEYNLEAKGLKFIELIRDQARMRPTNQLVIPFGGDFAYSSSGQNFKNLDKLMAFVRTNANSSEDINIFYSTPSCYQKAIQQIVQEQVISLPEKYSDFMPYSSSDNNYNNNISGTYWNSGYFSSRPTIKLIERFTANLLQVSRFISLANLLKRNPVGLASERKWLQSDLRDHENRCLTRLWETLAELQHHHTITGTHKQHVYDDYVRRTSDAISVCTKFIGDMRRTKIIEHAKKSLKYEQFKESGKRYKLDAIFLDSTVICPSLNISQCDPLEASIDPKRYQPIWTNHTSSSSKLSSTGNGNSAASSNSVRHSPAADSSSFVPYELETKSVLMNVYNPLAHPIVQHEIRLPCNGRCDLDKVKLIHLSTNEAMRVVRLPLQSGIIKLPFREAITSYELLFYANIPALGYTSFVIEDENDEEVLDDFKETNTATYDTYSGSNGGGGGSSNTPAPSEPATVGERTRSLSHSHSSTSNQHDTQVIVNGGATASLHSAQIRRAPIIRGRRVRREAAKYANESETGALAGALNDRVLLLPGENKYKYFSMQEFSTHPPPPPAPGYNLKQQKQHQQSHLNSRQKRQDHPTGASANATSAAAALGSSSFSQHSASNKVIVKFDMNTGMIVALKRVSDGSVLNITQRFGYYFPSSKSSSSSSSSTSDRDGKHNTGAGAGGAYIFRPNTSEPYLLEKPSNYKMFKRHDGSLIEIHQKWTSWLWQTIRIDAKKNYIEFDYVVGPIPLNEAKSTPELGKEIISRYITSLSNNGTFMTDSNGRQLMLRHRNRMNQSAEDTGGSFYPVTSTLMMKNTLHADHSSGPNQSHSSSGGATGGGTNGNRCSKCQAEVVAILVDRAQAGNSLGEGQLELLVHRRNLIPVGAGNNEQQEPLALNEPGEDGRGLVVRGVHRLYLKFQEHQQDHKQHQDAAGGAGSAHTKKANKLFRLPQTPRFNLDYEQDRYDQVTGGQVAISSMSTYIVHDQVINDLRVEANRFALRPTLTFDRLRVSGSELVEMLANSASTVSSNTNSNTIAKTLKIDLNLLNATLPPNIHLLTLQPWSSAHGINQLLLRLENLDNPITLHPFPDYEAYQSLVQAYKRTSEIYDIDQGDGCQLKMRPRTELNVEYLIKRIRIVALEELNLGANERTKVDKRINWTDEGFERESCRLSTKAPPTLIELTPREIRTFLAKFEFL